jgi:hypothetical protein
MSDALRSETTEIVEADYKRSNQTFASGGQFASLTDCDSPAIFAPSVIGES